MTAPSQKPEPASEEPPNLRFLRRLVTLLTAVMILGVLLIVVMLFIRLNSADQSTFPRLPDNITLPEGATVLAVTAGRGWYAVVTTDNRLFVFDARSGDLRQEIDISQ